MMRMDVYLGVDKLKAYLYSSIQKFIYRYISSIILWVDIKMVRNLNRTIFISSRSYFNSTFILSYINNSAKHVHQALVSRELAELTSLISGVVNHRCGELAVPD